MDVDHGYCRGPFQLPSTRVFKDFCEVVVKRYCLDGLVTKAKVG